MAYLGVQLSIYSFVLALCTGAFVLYVCHLLNLLLMERRDKMAFCRMGTCLF